VIGKTHRRFWKCSEALPTPKRRNHPLRLALLLLFPCFAFIAFPGCAVPWNLTIRPGATGKVVNATTGRPIPGAIVTVGDQDPRDYSDIPTAQHATFPDGSFSLPPYRRWGFNILFESTAGSTVPFSITRRGYRPYNGLIYFDYLDQGKKSTKSLGTIPLRTSPF